MTTESNEKSKRYRYTRPPVEKRKGIALGRSKVYDRILYHCYKLKFVTAPILSALIYADRRLGILPAARGKSGGLDVLTVQRQIKKLYDNGYLDKRFQVIKSFRPDSLQTLYTPDIYILGSAGREYLSQYILGRPLGEIKSPRMPDISAAHRGHPQGDYARMLHSRLISEVVTGFYAFCALYPDSYELVWYCHDREFDFEYTGVNGRRRVIPDAVLIVRSKVTGRLAHFFIEVDRNTESMQKFKHKLRGFGDLLKDPKTGIYDFAEQLYGQVAKDGGEPLPLEQCNNFRVLTLTTSHVHRDFLSRSTGEFFGKSPVAGQFYFGLIDMFSFYKRNEETSVSGNTYTKQVLDFSCLDALFKGSFRIPSKEELRPIFKQPQESS